MAVPLSLNVGAVSSTIAVASVDLGESLGNLAIALLFLMYTAVGCVSPVLTQWRGPRPALVAALFAYSALPAACLAASLVPRWQWPLVVAGSTISGGAAGVLWSAQGVYYALSAELYAAAAGVKPEAANAELGALFAALYLTAEMSLKLATSLVPILSGRRETNAPLFGLLTVVQLVCALIITRIDALEEDHVRCHASVESPTRRPSPARREVLSALRLFVEDSQCRRMLPMNLTMGLSIAYLNGSFNRRVVAKGVGAAAVGFASAVEVAAAAGLSRPYGAVGKRCGSQAPICVLGALSLLGFAAVNVAVAPATLGRWAFILPLACLFGSGRATWEGNAKARCADLFPSDRTAAFANMQLQCGAGSAAGFFIVLLAPPAAVAYAIVGCAALAVGALLASDPTPARPPDAAYTTLEH